MATNDRVLMHHGVLGMHWGIRKAEQYKETARDFDRIANKMDRAVQERRKRARRGGMGKIRTAWNRNQINRSENIAENYRQGARNYRKASGTLRKREANHPGDYTERVMGYGLTAGTVAFLVSAGTMNVPIGVISGVGSGLVVEHLIKTYNDNHPAKKKN